MSDGVHLMIPAEEYSEMEAKIECLEKALDKVINEIVEHAYFGLTVERCFWTPDNWKEWLMKDD